MKIFLSFIIIFSIFSSCSKKISEPINPSESTFEIKVGENYWGYSQNPAGEYIEEPFVFSNDKTEVNSGKMILNYNKSGNLLLTFYPEYEKITPNNPQIGPNFSFLIQGNAELYAILSRQDKSTLFSNNGKDFKKLKMTFKDNSFIILRKDWQNQVKRLTDGLPCSFSQIGIGLDKVNENYLLIDGKKIPLN